MRPRTDLDEAQVPGPHPRRAGTGQFSPAVAAPWIVLAAEEDVLAAQERVRALRRDAHIAHEDAFELQAAVSELAQSLLRRAPRNACLSLGPIRRENRRGMVLAAELYAPRALANWPGTPEQLAREECLPRALYLIKRLMDEFSLRSLPGGGTRISAVKWLRPPRALASA